MIQGKVKQLLSDGKAAWGAALVDASDLVAKFTVDTGIDFLWIDLEHRPYGVNEVKWIPIICRMKGCDAIVRVAHNDPALIKKALDIGATGVMIPQVNNVDEARRAVAHCKYPPQGSRGVSPHARVPRPRGRLRMRSLRLPVPEHDSRLGSHGYLEVPT